MSDEECVACLVNMEKVAHQLKISTLMFRGENGQDLAATFIQKFVRGFVNRIKFKRIKQMIVFVKVYLLISEFNDFLE